MWLAIGRSVIRASELGGIMSEPDIIALTKAQRSQEIIGLLTMALKALDETKAHLAAAHVSSALDRYLASLSDDGWNTCDLLRFDQSQVSVDVDPNRLRVSDSMSRI